MSHTCPLCGIDVGGVALLGSSCIVFLIMLLFLPINGFALDRQDAELIPHVDQRARDNFVDYLYADHNKAFAIAPGGAWAWSAQQLSVQAAKTEALQNCQSHTQQQCVLYAMNNKKVFDRKEWASLWRLANKSTTTSTTTGIARGKKFPNLLIKNQQGKSIKLHNIKAGLRLVHFWGSWCPPCMREMPSLLKLQQTLEQGHGQNIKLVLLQVREPFSQSLNWAKQQGFARLPLYNSGIKNADDSDLKVANGKTVTDRKLARAFPTSYILDAKGRVLFSHTGPIHDWLEYVPFFNDIIRQGKRKDIN